MITEINTTKYAIHSMKYVFVFDLFFSKGAAVQVRLGKSSVLLVFRKYMKVTAVEHYSSV